MQTKVLVFETDWKNSLVIYRPPINIFYRTYLLKQLLSSI